MNTNNKLNKAKTYRLSQDLLRDSFKKGVNLIAPETIFLSEDTSFGKNVTIEPYVVFGPKVKIGDNSLIKSLPHRRNKNWKNVVVGPYARLRQGTILKSNTKVGNFVETKKSNIDLNSKVNHLSYIGDTSIGKNSNIGAGTITCNYDGHKKSKTKISDNVFVGSNSSLVAPIEIGKGSTVGAGSVITKKVKEKSLAITRPAQQEIKNYRRKKKK